MRKLHIKGFSDSAEGPKPAYILVDALTGKPVPLPYDTTDFRGDPIRVNDFSPPHKPNSTGRIHCTSYVDDCGTYDQSFYPSGAGLKLVTEAQFMAAQRESGK